MAETNRTDEIQGEIIHVYDGIEEADNELPRWWLATFYGAIFFAIGYWFYYQGFGVGALPMQAYAEELQAAAAAGGDVSDELIEALAQDGEAVASGQSTFIAQCAVCHREDGSGNIGPNLTDDYWLHGGSASAIHNTIRDGATTAGMPAWGPTLGPRSVQQLAAYLVTIRGTNLEGKEPQGERMGAASADAAAAAEEATPAEAEPSDEAPSAEAEGGSADAPEPTEAPEPTAGDEAAAN